MELDKIFYIDFTTNDPNTGGSTNADTTPTCDVFENNNNTPIYSPTVTSITAIDGAYRIETQTSAANGFELGKSYNVLITATVGGVTGKQFLSSFLIEANIFKMLEDLHTIQGLNAANPSTTNILTKKWTAGSIVIDMSGDLQNITTLTRQ